MAFFLPRVSVCGFATQPVDTLHIDFLIGICQFDFHRRSNTGEVDIWLSFSAVSFRPTKKLLMTNAAAGVKPQPNTSPYEKAAKQTSSLR